MVIETVLVDDEPLARRKLRELLQRDPEVLVIGEASSGSEAVRLVRRSSPQVLFLDVRMPGLDAFAVIDQISAQGKQTMPRVIITTAYDEYALRAFDIHAADYLLKPFTAERLHSAVQRVRDQLLITKPAAGNSSLPGANENKHLNRLVFKSRGRILFLRVSEIRWIGAEENYVRINTSAESHLLRETISSMEERLDPHTFLRVHRSAIVNLQYLKEIRADAHGDFSAVLVNGQKVDMSRGYHSRVRDLLGDWLFRAPKILGKSQQQGFEQLRPQELA